MRGPPMRMRRPTRMLPTARSRAARVRAAPAPAARAAPAAARRVAPGAPAARALGAPAPAVQVAVARAAPAAAALHPVSPVPRARSVMTRTRAPRTRAARAEPASTRLSLGEQSAATDSLVYVPVPTAKRSHAPVPACPSAPPLRREPPARPQTMPVTRVASATAKATAPRCPTPSRAHPLAMVEPATRRRVATPSLRSPPVPSYPFLPWTHARPRHAATTPSATVTET
jgi:hypothetical protein